MDADFLLIHKMKNGDEEAIEVFVKKYYSTIRNYCRLHTYTDCDKEYICRTNATLRHGRCLPIECVFDNQHFCVTDCIYGYLNTIYFANECDMLHMFSITLQ